MTSAIRNSIHQHAMPLLLAAAAIVTIGLSACGTSEPSPASGAGGNGGSEGTAPGDDQSGTGGTLRIAMSAGNIPIPDTPPTEGGEGSRFVGFQVYDGLLNWDLLNAADSSALPGPGLAESWEVGEDQLTWTLHLRQGVKFHDGTDFNADAVIFNLDRIMTPDFEYYSAVLRGANAQHTRYMESWTKVDDYTVEIKTTEPHSFLPYSLIYIYIASPTAVMEWGNDLYPQHAVGTGPFMIARYIDGEVMELVPNADYWRGAPKLDRIALYPIPEPATRLAALQSGQVDWAEVPPPDAKAQLEAGGFTIELNPYPHVITYQLNLDKEPLQDIRVRQALNYAQDRESVCTALLSDLCLPASQYVPPGHQWYAEEYEGFSYDPDRARELLADAGYAEGLTLRMGFPTGGSGNMWPQLMNEKFQQDLAAVGVEVELVPMEWNNVITGYRNGLYSPDFAQYDILHISLGASNPQGIGNYSSNALAPDGCCNAPGYSSEEFDRLYAEAALAFDQEEQDRLLTEALVTVTEDAPWVLTVHDLNFRVLSPKVRGFVMAQSWVQDLTQVWVAD